MPSKPKMFAFGKELKEHQIAISLTEPDVTVTIECVALNGIPPPDFCWKLNGVLLRSVPTDSNTPGETIYSYIYFGFCKDNTFLVLKARA